VNRQLHLAGDCTFGNILTIIRYFSEEEAVLSCRAGVFQHSEGNWKQVDGGSSRIWLMKHAVYVAYRVVGCREDNQEVHIFASIIMNFCGEFIFCSDSAKGWARAHPLQIQTINRNYDNLMQVLIF
jgi:hypothetical protein